MLAGWLGPMALIGACTSPPSRHDALSAPPAAAPSTAGAVRSSQLPTTLPPAACPGWAVPPPDGVTVTVDGVRLTAPPGFEIQPTPAPFVVDARAREVAWLRPTDPGRWGLNAQVWVGRIDQPIDPGEALPRQAITWTTDVCEFAPGVIAVDGSSSAGPQYETKFRTQWIIRDATTVVVRVENVLGFVGVTLT